VTARKTKLIKEKIAEMKWSR